MTVDYQKLYAHLAGRIDDTLKLLDLVAVNGNSMEMVSSLVRESLIRSLQDAEEMYIEETAEK